MESLDTTKAYEDDKRYQGVREFIFCVKDAFYSSEQFTFAKKKAEVIKNLVNMTWAKGAKTTKYGYMTGIAHMVYRSTLETLEDLMDQDDLFTADCLNRSGNNVKLAEELGYYANNVAAACNYGQHLSKRWPYVLTYGFSPALDTYRFNRGWVVKPQASSVGPGGGAWGREMDVRLDRPEPLVLHPWNVFGSSEHAFDEQPHKGWLKRWTIADVIQAENATTADGKPIYNPQAIQAMKAILGKKGQEADQHYHQSAKRDLDTTETVRNDKLKMSYVDVVCFRGRLNMVDGFELDPNIYEVECTRNFILRITEQPVDTFDYRTDLYTHPYMESPFGGTYIDPTVGHQRMTDQLNNLVMESTVDNLHQYYTYRYEDITNLEDLKNPRGLRTFLELSANGQAPALIEHSRSGPASDALQFMERIREDLQRFSTTDQEAGIADQGKTLGESKILLAASSKRLRAGIKLMDKFGIRHQIRNLVYLSLVNQDPGQAAAYTRDGKPIQMTPEHMAALQNGTIFRLNNAIVRNKYEDNLKNSEFYINSLKILAQVQDPGYAIKVLRYIGKESGIKDIDEILPAPAPPDASAQPPMPPGQPPPQAMPQKPSMPMDFQSMLQQARQEPASVAA